jgi:hypothetical protein
LIVLFGQATSLHPRLDVPPQILEALVEMAQLSQIMVAELVVDQLVMVQEMRAVGWGSDPL